MLNFSSILYSYTGAVERREMSADQPGFAVSQVDVSFRQLSAAGTQSFHLPSFEGQAGFEAILDEIVMACAPIGSNQIPCRFLCFFLAHGLVIDAFVCERIIRAKRCKAAVFI